MTDILNHPTCETDRFIHRCPREDDFDAFADFCTTERSAFTGGPLDREGARRLFLSSYGHWLVHGFGIWTTVDKTTGLAIGRNGLTALEGHEQPELTMYFYEGYEGADNAPEVLGFLLSRGRAMGHDWVVARIAPFNERSLRLPLAVGGVQIGDQMTSRGPLRVYRVPTEETVT